MADKKDKDEDEKEKDQEGAEEGQENSEEQEAEAKKKKKKKIILIAVAAVVFLGAVGSGVYFSGILKPTKTETLNKKAKKHHKEGEEGAHGSSGSSVKAVKQNLGEWTPGPVPGHEGDDVQYYNLPEFLVNLNTGGKQTSFIKMEVTLEVPTEGDNDAIDSRMPRITDSFNTYLRELRAGDIAGSAGLYRLREELLLRINKIIYPNKVNDVLFREIIIQ
ncbi:MAG TPA: flagellar basal body-associated FliL family protein [Rickettsiales bacterium]|nr:flagellar basal body-associated FliL family protein [Rickettsiales bacterium]